MKVALGTFACVCIEARFGPDIAAGLREILRSYVSNLESSAAPPPFPHFRRADSVSATALELELEVAEEIEEALRLEARRQEIDLDQLLTHAVFVYLATA